MPMDDKVIQEVDVLNRLLGTLTGCTGDKAAQLERVIIERLLDLIPVK